MNKRYEVRAELKNERTCYFVYEIDVSDSNKTRERVIDGAVIRRGYYPHFEFVLFKALGSENFGRLLDKKDLQDILGFRKEQNPDANLNNSYKNFPFFNTINAAMKAANDYAEQVMVQLKSKQKIVSKVESDNREKEDKNKRKLEVSVS